MSFQNEWDKWRSDRLKAVVAPEGNLALIETRWFDGEDSQSTKDALLGQPNTVIATELKRKDFDGKVIAKGIRLWDSNSESI